MPQEVPLVNAVSLLLSFRLICRFERFLWGHEDSYFVFGHNKHNSIDRLISKTVLAYVVAEMKFPLDKPLHKIRSMCVHRKYLQ